MARQRRPADETSPFAIWKRSASEAQGGGFHCGHFVMEEKQREVLATLVELLRIS